MMGADKVDWAVLVTKDGGDRLISTNILDCGNPIG